MTSTPTRVASGKATRVNEDRPGQGSEPTVTEMTALRSSASDGRQPANARKPGAVADDPPATADTAPLVAHELLLTAQPACWSPPLTPASEAG